MGMNDRPSFGEVMAAHASGGFAAIVALKCLRLRLDKAGDVSDAERHGLVESIDAVLADIEGPPSEDMYEARPYSLPDDVHDDD